MAFMMRIITKSSIVHVQDENVKIEIQMSNNSLASKKT